MSFRTLGSGDKDHRCVSVPIDKDVLSDSFQPSISTPIAIEFQSLSIRMSFRTFFPPGLPKGMFQSLSTRMSFRTCSHSDYYDSYRVSVPIDKDVLSDERIIKKSDVDCFSPYRQGCPFGQLSALRAATKSFSPYRQGCPFGPKGTRSRRANVSVPIDKDVLSDTCLATICFQRAKKAIFQHLGRFRGYPQLIH